MHPAASRWVMDRIADHGLDRPAVTVLDLGGRYVNGNCRHLFTDARYLVVDIAPHPSVDVVADAADLCLDELFDVAICTEVLEHAARAAEIVANACRHLTRGGVFIATMAGPGRPEHGADGAGLRAGEWYRNVEPDELEEWLRAAGFAEWSVDVAGEDVRCVAVKGA